jgi:hypothetical protein
MNADIKQASQKPKYFIKPDKDTDEVLTLLATSLDVDGGILTMKAIGYGCQMPPP